MTLAKRATSGDVIWMRRSLERIENRGDSGAAEDRFAAGLSPQLDREGGPDGAPLLDVRVRLELRNAMLEANFEVIARFVFGDDLELPEDDEVREFLRDYGVDYAFGFVRAALADDLRVFGLPPGILPATALDEVKAAELFPVREIRASTSD